MYCSIRLLSYTIASFPIAYLFLARRVLHLAELLQLAAALLLAIFAVHSLAKQENQLVVLLAQALHFLLHLLHLFPLAFATIPGDLAVSLQAEFLAVLFREGHVYGMLHSI